MLFASRIVCMTVLVTYCWASNFRVGQMSVTRFEDLNKYYLQLKTDGALYSIEDIEQMEKICDDILQTRYFEIRQESYRDLYLLTNKASDHTRCIDRLFSRCFVDFPHTKTKTAFKPVNIGYQFVDEAVRNIMTMISVRGEKYGFLDKYAVTNLMLINIEGRSYMETVFACPIVEARTQLIKPYFISRTFNNNEWFIITLNNLGQPSFLALAEKTGSEHVFDLAMLESNFLSQIRGVKYVEVDPICRLSEGEKVRLCSAVINSISWESLQFWPNKYNVNHKCNLNAVSFQYKHLYVPHNTSMQMIGCKIKNMTLNKSDTYFVSRNLSNASAAFVFKKEKGHFYIRYMPSNILFMLRLGLYASK